MLLYVLYVLAVFLHVLHFFQEINEIGVNYQPDKVKAMDYDSLRF